MSMLPIAHHCDSVSFNTPLPAILHGKIAPENCQCIIKLFCQLFLSPSFLPLSFLMMVKILYFQGFWDICVSLSVHYSAKNSCFTQWKVGNNVGHCTYCILSINQWLLKKNVITNTCDVIDSQKGKC